jgi:uncharacterized membrane protein required for colicin V production
MIGSIVLDVVLVAILIAYLVYGYRTGLIRSLGGIIGLVIGAFLAIFLVPIVQGWVQDPDLRTVATIAVVVLAVVGFYATGAALGRAIQSRVRGVGLRRVDRALGAVVVTIVAALVASMLAASIGGLGFPALSQAIASSRVLQVINAVTPVAVQGFLAQVRSAEPAQRASRTSPPTRLCSITRPSPSCESPAMPMRAGRASPDPGS